MFHFYLKVRKSEPENIYILDDCIFEAISKQSWTDVLVQIYKVRCYASFTAELCVKNAWLH